MQLLLNEELSMKKDAAYRHGLWAKTEVIFGYGKVYRNPTGKSSLEETVFTNSNTVPIGGVQYVFEEIFGVKGPINIPTLYDQLGIGVENSPVPTETYNTPDGAKSVIYRPGNKCCLFGIGISGSGENDTTVYKVDYRETAINESRVNADGATITGVMIPFRYTNTPLDSVSRKKYFGKITFSDGYTGYYLKKFEAEPEIKHVWKTGRENYDSVSVSEEEIMQNITGVNTIESFTEMVLQISMTDVMEWATSLDQQDRARINTLALYTGEFVNSPIDGYGDYRDCRMFSKLMIDVESLSISKDLNIIYRVYGS